MNSRDPLRPYVPREQGAESRQAPSPFVLLPPYVYGRTRPAPALSREEVKVEAEVITAPVPPPIEEYVDELPSIDEFAPAPVEQQDWPSWGEPETPVESADQWQDAEWQGFDWGSAAGLGIGAGDVAAAQAWASTDWDNPRDPVRPTQSAAEALADALDQIVQRIRAGEVSLPAPKRVKDESAIAATLAALLGIQR